MSSAEIVFRVLDEFQQHAENEKREAPERISLLVRAPGVDIFHLTEKMLIRSTEIAVTTGLALESFDLAIFSAITVKGQELSAEGHEVSFCTLDADLQPWDRRGNRKTDLAAAFDTAGIWVYGDYLLEYPTRP